MVTLYHCAGARSFRALWTLEELGIPYELKLMPFPPRFRQEGYLDLNPLGTVPTMVDEGRMMTESAAICHYLVTRHGPSTLAVTPDEADYGPYLNFLHMGEATLTFPQTIFLRYTVLEPQERRVPQAAEDYARWFHARLKAAATMIGPEFACAGRFTAADISVGYAIKLAGLIGLGEAMPDSIKAYWARISDRDGYRRAMAAETAA